jgi:hypothetical protein
MAKTRGEQIAVPVAIIVTAALLIAIGYNLLTASPAQLPPDQFTLQPGCHADGDCVPAECCHPTSCVNAQDRPSCREVICTLECRPDTMDCGQGRCACVEGQCTAVYG